MYKLFFRIKDQINYELKYLDNIKDLAMHYQKIHDHMITTNWI